MKQLLNSRVAQIEKFDVKVVKTLGDLVYIFQIITETILHLEKTPCNRELLNLLKMMLNDIIKTALEANETGFKDQELRLKLEVEFSLLTKYLKSALE